MLVRCVAHSCMQQVKSVKREARRGVWENKDEAPQRSFKHTATRVMYVHGWTGALPLMSNWLDCAGNLPRMFQINPSLEEASFTKSKPFLFQITSTRIQPREDQLSLRRWQKVFRTNFLWFLLLSYTRVTHPQLSPRPVLRINLSQLFGSVSS